LGTSDNGCHRRGAEHRDDVWCWDFVFDRTTSGGTLKWLSIVEEHTRECLALKVSRSITSEDVIDTLAELFTTLAPLQAESNVQLNVANGIRQPLPPEERAAYADLARKTQDAPGPVQVKVTGPLKKTDAGFVLQVRKFE
jgi:transposase InsO family protein